MLGSLFDFIRDLAILAAALGVVRWTWDWHAGSAARRDEAASAALAAERHAADMRQMMARLDERVAGIAQRIDEAAGIQHRAEMRAAARVQVHRLLQSTGEPFLSFAEIEQAMNAETRLPDDGPEAAEAGESPAGDALRRVLIELVSDGVVAQLDRDRYFIASDYETGGEANG